MPPIADARVNRSDLPLEQLVRRPASVSQASFAITAKRLIDYAFSKCASERLDFHLDVSRDGLAVLARHEDALSLPLGLLREVYGDGLVLAPLRPRMMEGVPPREPVMGVHITISPAWRHAVQSLLQRRRASPVEERDRSPYCVLRCEAPLADLLGLPAELSKATSGSARYVIALSRYAPACAVS